jgi:hypothetical protein
VTFLPGEVAGAKEKGRGVPDLNDVNRRKRKSQMATNDSIFDRLEGLAAEVEKIAKRPQPWPRPEKVRDLSAAGVRGQQICLIWSGRVGNSVVSPYFVEETEFADEAKIQRQAKYETELAKLGKSDIEPVVSDSWIPPWEEYQRKQADELREKVAARLQGMLDQLRG